MLRSYVVIVVLGLTALACKQHAAPVPTTDDRADEHGGAGETSTSTSRGGGSTTIAKESSAEAAVTAVQPINPLLLRFANEFVDEALDAAIEDVFEGDPGVRKQTEETPVKGMIREVDGAWIVSLVLDDARFAFRTDPTDAQCLPDDWTESIYPEISLAEKEEARRETRSLRLELGELGGRPAWLRFDGDAVHLVVESPKCSRAKNVTDDLTGALSGDDDDLSIQSELLNGAWTGLTTHDVADLIAREVPGGFELVDDAGETLLAPGGIDRPKSDGCLEGELSYRTHDDGRLASLRWHYRYVTACESDKGDFREEEFREEWVRRPDNTFQRRHARQVFPLTTDPIIWRGSEIEWRMTPKRAKQKFEVVEVTSSQCEYEVWEQDFLTRWEVRPVGGAWTDLGAALQRRYEKTLCTAEDGTVVATDVGNASSGRLCVRRPVVGNDVGKGVASPGSTYEERNRRARSLRKGFEFQIDGHPPLVVDGETGGVIEGLALERSHSVTVRVRSGGSHSGFRLKFADPITDLCARYDAFYDNWRVSPWRGRSPCGECVPDESN